MKKLSKPLILLGCLLLIVCTMANAQVNSLKTADSLLSGGQEKGLCIRLSLQRGAPCPRL